LRYDDLRIKEIKMRKLWLLVLVVWLGSSLNGCWPVKQANKPAEPDGTVAEENSLIGINADNYWQYLPTSSGKSLSEEKLSLLVSERNAANYLRICGGLKPEGYVLTTEDDQTISQSADLAKKLAPINSAAVALALIYAQNCYLSPEFNGYHQFVNRTSDGWQVAVIQYYFIGCGNHAHHQLLFDVKSDGSWQKVGDSKLEEGKEFCGD
jgi:hypothetical protein